MDAAERPAVRRSMTISLRPRYESTLYNHLPGSDGGLVGRSGADGCIAHVHHSLIPIHGENGELRKDIENRDLLPEERFWDWGFHSATMKRKGMAIAFLVVILFVSGCSMLDSGSQSEDRPPVIRDVFVMNEDNQSYKVDLVVLHDETVVYWTTRTVDGHDTDRFSPQVLENTTKTYTLMVRLNNSSRGVRYSTEHWDFLNSKNDCISIGVMIHDGTFGPAYGGYPDDQCEYPWTRTT